MTYSENVNKPFNNILMLDSDLLIKMCIKENNGGTSVCVIGIAGFMLHPGLFCSLLSVCVKWERFLFEAQLPVWAPQGLCSHPPSLGCGCLPFSFLLYWLPYGLFAAKIKLLSSFDLKATLHPTPVTWNSDLTLTHPPYLSRCTQHYLMFLASANNLKELWGKHGLSHLWPCSSYYSAGHYGV